MTMQIMLCESEPVLETMIREYLLPLGFKVVVPSEKNKCQDLIKRKMPDVILLDTHMREANIENAVQKIRNMGLKSPILLLGANYGITSKEDALSLGANGFLEKPFKLKELLESVVNLIPN